MGIVLGPNRYGKAENRVVRIYRDSDRHEIRDITVSTSLTGDFAAAHLTGDQSQVLPTDSQKNTCYALAQQPGIGSIEDYAITLATHFFTDLAPVGAARIAVAEHAWERIVVGGRGHDHTWQRSGREVRTTEVTVDGAGVQVVSGLTDLVLLKSTGSEFAGFLTDDYTTLAETHDRVLSTSVQARWRYVGRDISAGTAGEIDWDSAYADIRRLLLERFAEVYSLALQQTLWEMGRAVLVAHPEVAEIELVAPNRHHFLVDLAPFGLTNDNEVFYAADRPYGLIECTVTRDDDPAGGPAQAAAI